MAEQDPEKQIGRKGGAADAYMVAPGYHVPEVSAVTDIAIPPDRVQWGPVFAGLIVAFAVGFLFTSLGVAIGIGTAGIGYWVIGFTALGLFLGAWVAARTARAPSAWPAILHATILWGVVMILNVVFAGSIGGSVVGAMMARTPATGVPTGAVTSLGWYFFGGFLIMLAASILGALVGINPSHAEEEGGAVQNP